MNIFNAKSGYNDKWVIILYMRDIILGINNKKGEFSGKFPVMEVSLNYVYEWK